MKTDITTTLNKLIAYARDNLMLDALDETYTLNKLAALCGVPVPAPSDMDVDNVTLDKLLDELKLFVPSVDVQAVLDALMPAQHMVDYWFADQLQKNANKAFDFLYELMERGGCASGDASGKDGYIHYTAANTCAPRAVYLDVNGQVKYTPRAACRIAAVACDDILTADVAARMSAFATAYGAICKKLGDDGEYLCCADIAPAHAKVKKTISDGPAKVALLDYPVPALSVSGIAKNAVQREAARLAKRASDAGLEAVMACASTSSGEPVFYLVFAGKIKTDDIIVKSDALSACGVCETADLTPLRSVLEKGTALSADLFAFKPLYAAIGGVKHGAKAQSVLDGEVAKYIATALAAATSATDQQVEDLTAAE